jgi:hypothetical protein
LALSIFSEREMQADISAKELDIALKARDADGSWKYYMNYKNNVAPWMEIAHKRKEKADMALMEKLMSNSDNILDKVWKGIGRRTEV